MIDSGLSGKTALVTGGSRGIGRAVCLALAEEGVKVAVNYVSDDAAAEETRAAVAAHGVACQTYKADVSDPPQVRAMVAAIETDLGAVDLLVANAGYAKAEDPDNMSLDVWRKVMAVNADGTYLTVNAVVPGMKERGYGRIVCTASVAALRPRPGQIAYSAAKAAVVAFVRSCSEAFAPHVRINCVAPGLIATEMADTLTPEVQANLIASTPLGRIGKPEEIAQMVLFLLSDGSSYSTGQVFVASGGRVTLP
jgi:NAD(P)-dependent dehydrogenase (short-subunit alcohol dehydrogenase family)